MAAAIISAASIASNAFPTMRAIAPPSAATAITPIPPAPPPTAPLAMTLTSSSSSSSSSSGDSGAAGVGGRVPKWSITRKIEELRGEIRALRNRFAYEPVTSRPLLDVAQRAANQAAYGDDEKKKQKRSSGGNNGNAKIAPALKRRLVSRRQLRGHHGKIITAAWCHDSRHIVSGSQDGRLLLWNGHTGKPVGSIPLRSRWVATCAWSPGQGEHIAHGGLDNIVTVWRSPLAPSKVPTETKRIVSGLMSAHVTNTTLDMATMDLKTTTVTPSVTTTMTNGHTHYDHHDDNNNDDTKRTFVDTTTITGNDPRYINQSVPLSSITVSNVNGEIIVRTPTTASVTTSSSSSPPSLTSTSSTSTSTSAPTPPTSAPVTNYILPTRSAVWRVNEHAEPLTMLQGHDGYVASMRWIDERRIISSSGDTRILIWDIERPQPIGEYHGHQGDVMDVRMSLAHPHHVFVSGAIDARAHVWDMRLPGNQPCQTYIALNDVNQAVWMNEWAFGTSCDDGIVRLYDIRAMRQMNSYNITNGVQNIALAFSQTGSILFMGDEHGTIHVMDTISGAHVQRLRNHQSRISTVELSPDGKAVLSASWDACIHISA